MSHGKRGLGSFVSREKREGSKDDARPERQETDLSKRLPRMRAADGQLLHRAR